MLKYQFPDFLQRKYELNIPDFSKKNKTIHGYGISTYCTLIPSKYATFMWVNVSFPWVFWVVPSSVHPHIFNPHLPSQRLMNSHRRGHLRVPPLVETAAKNPRFILAKGVTPPQQDQIFCAFKILGSKRNKQTPQVFKPKKWKVSMVLSLRWS